MLSGPASSRTSLNSSFDSSRVAAQLAKVQLWISEESWLPLQQKFFEPGGDYLITRYSGVKVNREPEGSSKTFNVEMVRLRPMQGVLAFTVLTNSIDMEGDLPDEMTAEMKVRIEVEGHEPVVLDDLFSGTSFSGGRAPQALFSQISSVINLLVQNSYKPVRINRIECEATILPGRRTAEIDAVELDSETYAPGETVKATAFIRPFKGLQRRVPLTLKLPVDMPEGTYVVTVSDDLTRARAEFRDDPNLNNPQSLDQVFQALKVQTSAKRTNLVLRVPMGGVGVAMGGKALPNLPPSMVHILGNTRRTGAQTMGGALVSRQNTDWVIQGSDSVRFTVAKNKRTLD